MQLYIRIRPDKPIGLPINYNHILQAVIYRAVGTCDPAFAKHLHDEGVKNGPRNYKPFTFGKLEGKHVVKDKRIIFTDDVFWEVRSFDDGMIHMVNQYIGEYGIEFCSHKSQQICHKVSTHVGDYHVDSEKIVITARTPVTAYITQDSGFTEYFTPEEYGFYELTKQNSIRKYESVTGTEHQGPLDFSPVSVSVGDKVITTYKGTIIEGWTGKYALSGDSAILDFLFQTGLGAKSAQGFGMFDIVKPDQTTG